VSRLTVERLFADPPLSGTLPQQPALAPDGRYLCYLRPADDDRERLDLWRCDIESAEHRCWVDARQLQALTPAGELTSAEKAERERRRQFAGGITRFAFNPDGSSLLLPVDGAAVLFDTTTEQCHTVTPPATRQTDLRFSPRGHYLTYVRDNDLHLYDLQEGREMPITRDGSDTVCSGRADFLAQEEMHRFEGYWWHPEETLLAFIRVDEGPVAISRRYEIEADDFKVIEQRYPYAGAANPEVTLWCYRLEDGACWELPWQQDGDAYLARVHWFGDELAVQVQDRCQGRLSLRRLPLDGGAGRELLTERSTTWVNLHDNFHPLDPHRFLWTSEREGSSRLYLYEVASGGKNPPPRPLTPAGGRVQQLLYADASRVLYAGWDDTPCEQHLYRVDLQSGEQVRLNETVGWHDGSAAASGRLLLCRGSSLDEPGRLTLHDTVGGEAPRTLAREMLDERHPYAPYLPAHSTPTLGTLSAADGQTLHYRLTRPLEADGPCPAIVYVYGGPGVQRVRNEWPPLLLQLLQQQGFAVLELDNRGITNRGPAFEAPIHGRLGQIEVVDQVAGAEFLAGLDWIDGERIGVFGHSYGGYMALMCLCQAPRWFKAGVSVAPVTDWTLYDSHYTERYLGLPQDNAAGYDASSVFAHLDGLEGRLLLIHGMADDNVLFTHTTKLMKALQTRLLPFELMTYPGAKHGLQERDVATHRFRLILDFFQRHLVGAASTSPATARPAD